MKTAISIILLIIIAGILLLISSYNTEIVQLNYLLAVQSMPLSMVLAIFLFTGFALSTIAWGYYLLKLRFNLQQRNWKINKLNQEIELLRLQLKDK
ncbi:LapA family protein [Catenovulum sp. 2E275]|uniref:LapA family protein n=1 Tax=Catenovulum sp. 2E275 TaxID=2980497 RepID=UPI0021CF3E56|nr:LapA family protein [Catenovulum sp. 2E275]MCU4674492.1 LapA family protein [Catenovulum sp. 2E275]